MKEKVAGFLQHFLNFHHSSIGNNLVILSTPRSGSTWLAEIIGAEDNYKIVREPLNLRKTVVAEKIGNDWNLLYEMQSEKLLYDYLQDFILHKDRDYRFKRTSLKSDLWRFKTDKVLFKILFGGELYPQWFIDNFNAKIIFLTRHPIPVSISRKELPRIQSFFNSSYFKSMPDDIQNSINKVYSEKDFYCQAVIDWCFQNAPILNSGISRDNVLVITYEQLVLEPSKLLKVIQEFLGLKGKDKMESRIMKASGSTGKSDKLSKDILTNKEDLKKNREWLVNKWVRKTTPLQKEQCDQILSLFDIDIYNANNPKCNSKNWFK